MFYTVLARSTRFVNLSLIVRNLAHIEQIIIQYCLSENLDVKEQVYHVGLKTKAYNVGITTRASSVIS